MIRQSLRLFLVVLSTASVVLGQGSAGTDATIEPRTLVDMPTAGILSHRNSAVDLSFFQVGGSLAGFSVGIGNRFALGITYGGTSLLGSEKPSWNPRPGFNMKLRILDEAILFPAIALGFDSQGKEPYIDSVSRYTIKALGLYAAGSKNYQLIGFLSIHGGVNYSLEQGDGNKNLNFFAGIEKSFGPFASMVAEYNFDLNDDLHLTQSNRRAVLNGGIRISMGGGYTLGLNFKDISNSLQDVAVGNRTLQIEYVRPF